MAPPTGSTTTPSTSVTPASSSSARTGPVERCCSPTPPISSGSPTTRATTRSGSRAGGTHVIEHRDRSGNVLSSFAADALRSIPDGARARLRGRHALGRQPGSLPASTPSTPDRERCSAPRATASPPTCSAASSSTRASWSRSRRRVSCCSRASPRSRGYPGRARLARGGHHLVGVRRRASACARGTRSSSAATASRCGRSACGSSRCSRPARPSTPAIARWISSL